MCSVGYYVTTGWLVGWGLTALSAQIGYIMPWFIRSSAAVLTIVTLLFGVADQQLKRLQSVQNAAARLVTGTRRSDQRRIYGFWCPGQDFQTVPPPE